MNAIIITLFFLLTLSCIPRFQETPLPEESTIQYIAKQSPVNNKPYTHHLNRFTIPPVSKWIGIRFLVLPRQRIMQKEGYLLYSCIGDSCSLPIDSAWEYSTRRIRCNVLEYDTITVTTVTPHDKEWLVAFRSAIHQRPVYGMTHHEAISDIVPLTDLEHAAKRWIGRVIYSRKGTIFLNEQGSTLRSVRVGMFDSLIVTAVQCGRSPLPQNPVWLSVTVNSTEQTGIIPVRYSWLNTPPPIDTSIHPWEIDIFEQHPQTLFEWPDRIWEFVDNHRVTLGMSPKQVELSWGVPDSIVQQPDIIEKRYYYPVHIIAFQKGRCIHIQKR